MPLAFRIKAVTFLFKDDRLAIKSDKLLVLHPNHAVFTKYAEEIK
jgi:hypothetical protein